MKYYKLWPLLLPLLFLLPGLAGFPYPTNQQAFSDLALAHTPNLLYLRRALFELHTIPLWSPLILGGYPFAANPLSGLWYPPGWLALLLPVPLGFNLLIGLHFLWGGIGMYFLLRQEVLSHPAAMLGALAWEALPKAFAHYGAGHLTLLYALPWTPWLLLAAGTSVRRDNPEVDLRPGLIWGLIFLADPRWAAYSGVLWLGYYFFQTRKTGWENWFPSFRQFALQALTGALLCAPLALPLFEFARLSTRAHLDPAEVLVYSLPPARLLGFLFPDFGGLHEWMVYVGWVVLALALVAVFFGTKGISRFWLWSAVFAVLIALGEFLPPLALMARIPGVSLLRVPSRALFINGLAMAALFAYGADRVLSGATLREQRLAGQVLTGLVGLALALAGGVWALTGKVGIPFLWGAGLALAAGVWVALGVGRKISNQAWVRGLVILCLLDWGAVDLSLYSPHSASLVMGEGEATARWLADQSAGVQPGFRVYSPSYSLPQQTAASWKLDLADGVDPLQLASYANFFTFASGVPTQGYSVTLPPFANGDPSHDNAAYRPNPQLLGLLAVRFVAAAYDLPEDGLILRANLGGSRVYENIAARPRAWVQARDAPAGEGVQPAAILSWKPNRIEIEAVASRKEPAELVLAEVVYPGWSAWVDGQRVPVTPVAGLLRGVELTPGRHRVVFLFRPASVYAGVGLALLAIAITGLAGMHRRSRVNRLGGG